MTDEDTPPNLAANKPLKWLYCLTLVSMIIPSGLFGASGNVGMVTGGGLLGGGSIISLLIIFAALYRIYSIVRVSSALDACGSSRLRRTLRWLGIILMLIGVLASMSIIFIEPLIHMIFGEVEFTRAALFVVGIFLYVVSTAGWLGIIVFEIARSIRGGRVKRAA